MTSPAYEFKATRRVEFADTDMAGIMHFSNFFRFMESTETAFLRSLGLTIHPESLEKGIGWPRVHADCDFRRPLKFQDLVEIHLLVREKREKSIVYTFIFRSLNVEPGVELARGTLIAACVERDKGSGTMKAVPIPAMISEKIQAAPKELFE
jgi:YbgC/YbaW family acyl-CoA thioester hydrolase